MAVRIGLVGTGTVGGGCIDIILKHKDAFLRHYGIDIELARVCSLDPSEAEAHGVGHLFTDNFRDIIDDPDIDLVIELIGGTTFARTVVLDALAAGKNVVTANKALMATCGKEIMETAAAKNREIAFEASVGGGIPIIGPLKHSLIANEISSVMGIVNGTTNYMLTRMDEDGMDYDAVLAEAQAKGFAEANPSADVDGFDAAAKIAILASIAFNSRVTMDDVYTRGITNITPVDLETARDMGYVVKLLAIAHRTEGGIDVRVHPTMIPVDHQLAKVNGVFNAIYVTGDFVGETMFFGEGAGAGAAASAVMGDVLEVARHMQQGINPIVGCTCTDELPILPIEELSMKYYIRFTVSDRPGVLAAMAGVFANHGVSVHSVVQRGQKNGGTVEIVYVTHTAKERAIREVIEEIRGLDDVLHAEPSLIRVEE
ncbi:MULTISPECIES: homoserine dehydrogenase [unclassified Adlercreutzia]|uniref:homoserine dehydrogenase n=1 Tax=unclassified Adlercreutzia TaxID=2636013 RepID=UPI0013EE1A2D|nr:MULTISPECIES: homoserine dehydrogenase [unclassified Adlercreutzia]